MPDAARIRSMFARVAPRYDLVNDVLSCGVHRRWRRALVRYAGLRPGQRALDVCAGTLGLTAVLADAGLRATGVDFCVEMLQRAPDAARRACAGRAVGDALRLPFADGAFDAATIAFGARNVADPVCALREMARVCGPGGRVVVLEFCQPRTPGFRQLYGGYFRHVLPRLGGGLSRDGVGAYRYLQTSVQAFPEREAFLDLMREAGLQRLRFRLLSLGIAAIYVGEVEVR